MKCILPVLGLLALAATTPAQLIDVGRHYRIPVIPEPSDYAQVIYIDPAAATDGSGSEASPRNRFFGLTLQTDTAYLIKAGSVFDKPLDSLTEDIYIGRYGEGANPLFRSTGVCRPKQGDTFVGIDIEKYGGGGGSWDMILGFLVSDVTFAECRIEGLPNAGDGVYPYFVIKGEGGDRTTFFNCEISHTRVDGFLLKSNIKDFTFVGNYMHQVNLGGGPGDGIQMEGDGFDRAYFANNTIDRSDTPGKFCLIINATTGGSTGIEAAWNTFIAPKTGNSGAALHWYPGRAAKLHHNLIESRDGVSGISTNPSVANDTSPYGIRDNHLYGPGKHFYDFTDYPSSNRDFADLAAYEAYLATPGAVRYGSDRFSPDRDQAPTTPGNLVATPSYNSVQLSWAAATDPHGVAGYRIIRDGRTVGYAAGAETYADTGLATSTAYSYRIVAYDFAGTESGASALVNATTEDTVDDVPPSAPTDLEGVPTINSVALSWTASTDNLGVVDYRVYRDGSLLAEQAETTFTDTGLLPNSTYAYRVEAFDRSGNAASASLSVKTTDNGLVPGWALADLGDGASLPTTVDLTNDVLTMGAGGSDIWGTADGMGFVYRPLDGDGEIVARLTTLQNTNTWAKAGVMIREGLEANSPNAAMLLTPNKVAAFQWRPTAAADTQSTASTYPALPSWVRLVRSGNTFTASISSDGQSWSVVGSQTIAMGTQSWIGLALTSHNGSARNTSTFDGISVTSGNDSDLDQDGMDDAWESTALGGLNARPGDDPDRDGTTNLFEFLAGTDPMDPASCLCPLIVADGAGEVRFGPVRAGLRYRLEGSADLDAWSSVAQFDAVADAAEHAFTGLSGGAARFYRIRLEQP